MVETDNNDQTPAIRMSGRAIYGLVVRPTYAEMMVSSAESIAKYTSDAAKGGQ